MNQTSLRLRLVPRYPAKITATDGIKAVRDGVDLTVKSDYSNLVQVPTVSNPDRTFMLAWDSDIDNYQSVSFTNIINNIQDAIIGPPLAAIDAANPGANQVVYFTAPGVAANYTVSPFVRGVSNAADQAGFLSGIGAATAAQGAKADSALQPGEAATPAQGTKADNALPQLSSQFLVGAARYPTSIGFRVDNTSWLSANTVSGKTVYSGQAAKDGVTWVENIMPGTDQPGVVTSYANSPNGAYASVSAVRASDNPSGTRQNIIAHSSVGMVDNAAVAHNVWCNYDHGWWDAGAHPDSFLLNRESSIANLGAAAAVLTPFDLISGAANGNKGQKANVRYTAGTGLVASNRVSCPIQITSNNGVYAAGIVFGSGSLDSSSGYADALSMPTNTGISFYAATSTSRLWRIFSNVGTVANPGAIILGDKLVQIFQGDLDLATGGSILKIGGTKVVGSRATGWGADTGTSLRNSMTTYSATAEATYTQSTIQLLMDNVRNLSRTMKALKDDMITHGLIGP
ncbi:hypothetical protein [Rhizobium rhizogenes]|uniref:hypothetical protein n=1 Tax=Rhizobium rhizogenes TaxID=359 RepID=UPI0015737988|nr:hypothetical protein [Rhizobium rhizogenes]NTF43063.1 hypothetical protein [Rhizobium rhizogenes]